MEHARQGELWLGDVMKSPATGRPVVLLTAPIKAGTQVVGILGTPIELSNFSDSFVSKYRFRETGYVYMFDASGLVFAHPDASKIMSLNIAKTDFSGEMVSRANGSLSYVFEGIARTACFRRAQVKPWTIVAVVPDRELFASVRTIQFYLLLFARDTSALIEESLSKSQDGKHQLDNVLQAMEANNKIAGAVKAETDEIRGASEEQARGIVQISMAITQMSKVTQSTAAQAEESASAAEELSAQSHALKEIVERLTRLVDGGESGVPAGAHGAYGDR